MKCTSFVRQYDILCNKWGIFTMSKGVLNKRRMPEFKKHVVETIQQKKLRCPETVRRFEVNTVHRIQDWEQIYLTERAGEFADRALRAARVPARARKAPKGVGRRSAFEGTAASCRK